MSRAFHRRGSNNEVIINISKRAATRDTQSLSAYLARGFDFGSTRELRPVIDSRTVASPRAWRVYKRLSGRSAGVSLASWRDVSPAARGSDNQSTGATLAPAAASSAQRALSRRKKCESDETMGTALEGAQIKYRRDS